MGLFPLKSALFTVEKCPFSQKSALLLERKRPFLGRNFWGLISLKSFLFNVEKCSFAEKSALLLEKKKAFYGEEKNWAFSR